MSVAARAAVLPASDVDEDTRESRRFNTKPDIGELMLRLMNR
jgi:hypothetical protein